MDVYGNVTRVIGSSDASPLKGKKEPDAAGSATGAEASDVEEQQSSEGIKQPHVKGKALQASQQFEEKLMDIAGPGEREGSGGADEITLPMGNKNVTLKGVDIIDLAYKKRDEEEQAALRKQFNNRVRRSFMKDLGNDPEKLDALRQAGLNDTDIQMMQNGKVPPGFQVHHKLPLDDGGTNDFSNFVLIRNKPAHQAITNYQTQQIEGMPDGTDEVRHMEWPMPRGFIYPPDPSYVTESPRSR
ncbi:MAG: HNH endonuclease signature motif containing protein [Candidatus Eremiobacteraeota bacterium]|nr:HNH endonuclease signature motif containing protein [Candidatus Eremiobacteraeota bacterium]